MKVEEEGKKQITGCSIILNNYEMIGFDNDKVNGHLENKHTFTCMVYYFWRSLTEEENRETGI